MGRTIRASLGVAFAALALVSSAAAQSPPQLASLGPDGGNGPFSVQADFMNQPRDGSRVFFTTAEPLVAADTDQKIDVYESTGTDVALVSIGPQGGNGPFDASVAGSSFDGTRAFFSTTEALTADDPDTLKDVYERSGNSTTLVSKLMVCHYCNMDLLGASDDGLHVFYGPGDSVYEHYAGNDRLVSTGPTARPGTVWDEAHFLGSSADGLRVFFQSRDRLVLEDMDQCFGGPMGTCGDVYERSGGQTRLVSTGPAAANGSHHIGYQEGFNLSKDGTHAFFWTTENLVPEDTDPPGSYDIYERFGTQTRLVSTGPASDNSLTGAFIDHPGRNAVSEDGSRAFFVTNERLVPEDVDGTTNVYDSRDVYMRSGGTTTLISTGPADDGMGREASFERATPDGSHVVFSSRIPLTAEDTDTALDLYEWSNGTRRLVSIGPTGGNASCESLPSECWPGSIAISRDGARITFYTWESLVPEDTDAEGDIYQRFAGRTTLVTPGTAGPDAPYGPGNISVSPDGRRIFFHAAQRLASADTDGQEDVYLTTVNEPPTCADAVADPATLRVPNHRFRTVEVTGVGDPDGDPVSLAVTGVTQDERVDGTGDGATSPDAALTGTPGAVRLRAERRAGGDGRVYRVAFTATDSQGAGCAGTVKVGVPRGSRPARDSAPPSYDSFG